MCIEMYVESFSVKKPIKREKKEYILTSEYEVFM